MKWYNLKVNKCPQCNKTFLSSSFSKRLGYIVCLCGFTISNKRFSEIVNSQVKQDLPIDEDLEEKLQEEEDML